MGERTGSIDRLATVIARPDAIDWSVTEGNPLTTADLRRRFRIATAARMPAHEDTDERAVAWSARLYLAVAAIAVFKTAVAAGGFALQAPHLSSASWLQAATMLLYTVGGYALVVGSVADNRARALGALFIIIGASFANGYQPAAGVDHPFHAWTAALLRLPLDAFLAAALWLFVCEFPRPSPHRATRRLGHIFFWGAAAAGVVLAAVNVLDDQAVLSAGSSLAASARLLDRDMPRLLYWPLVFGLALPALPYLLWKSRFETVDARQRTVWFTSAVVLGLAPILLAVMLTPIVPALSAPGVRAALRWVLFVPLMLLIPCTTYAVVVHQVFDVRLVVRKAVRHRLARVAVWVGSLSPLFYFAYQVSANQELTIGELVERQSPAALVPPAMGLVLVAFRERLLVGVDRWFLRGAVDYAEAFARLERGFRATRSIQEMVRLLRSELERAVHPSSVVVLIARHHGAAFEPLEQTGQPLAAGSPLIELLYSARSSIQLDIETGPITRLLPEADRQWLLHARVRVLAPLFGSADALIGVVAIGESRGLAYTKQDLAFVNAVSGQAAMALENRYLRELDGSRGVERDVRDLAVNWLNEPGAQCTRCHIVSPGYVRACPCGAQTTAAVLPLVVNEKFRVERLIGSGGMGVVYLAIDVTLDRKVAIKTLPTMTAERLAALEREARAMALVLHPNLAFIYGTERWRGRLLLVVEHLSGGTLADRIRRGPLPVEQVLDMAIVLADVLDRTHLSGVLHRDLKPSNIGFTADGAPKLLDFGLAAMLSSSIDHAGSGAGDMFERDDPRESQPLHVSHGRAESVVVGTPLYLPPEALAGVPPQVSYDLWSLSLVLYEAIAGQHPFDAPSVSAVLERIRTQRVPDVRKSRPDCPRGLAALLDDALSPTLARRPATAAELRHRLRVLRTEVAPHRDRA